MLAGDPCRSYTSAATARFCNTTGRVVSDELRTRGLACQQPRTDHGQVVLDVAGQVMRQVEAVRLIGSKLTGCQLDAIAGGMVRISYTHGAAAPLRAAGGPARAAWRGTARRGSAAIRSFRGGRRGPYPSARMPSRPIPRCPAAVASAAASAAARYCSASQLGFGASSEPWRSVALRCSYWRASLLAAKPPVYGGKVDFILRIIASVL